MIISFTSIFRIYSKVLVFLCLISLFACTKGEDNDPTPVTPQRTCLLTKREKLFGFYTTMKYDADNKLISYSAYGPATKDGVESSRHTIVRDKSGKIIKILATSGSQDKDQEFIIDYDQSGRWIKTSCFYLQTDPNTPSYPIYTISVEYNSKSQISKVTRQQWSDRSTPFMDAHINTYEYDSGNIIRKSEVINDILITTTFGYDLTKEAKWTEYDLVGVYFDDPMPLTKNPVNRVETKTSLAENPEEPVSTYHITYEYNDEGYPNKEIWNPESNNPYTITNTYSFK